MADIDMIGVLRAVMQQLRNDVALLCTECSAFPHRVVAPRRRKQEAVVAQFDVADRRQPAAKVGIFAVELDTSIEAADAIEGVTPYREVAAVEHNADPQDVFHQNVRGGTQREIVGAQQDRKSTRLNSS